MIRHLVLFTLRPGVPADDPRVAAALAASRRLGEALPRSRSWQIEPNISDRDTAADFAAVGDVADAAALAEFLARPEHVAAGRLWRELATWAVADHVVPSGSAAG